MSTRQPVGQWSFQAAIQHLESVLAHRDVIVERIQAVLNAQRTPIEYQQDSSRLAHDVDDCVVAGVRGDRVRLRQELEDAHWAGGFRPRYIPGLHNGPADPAVMLTRAFHLWRQTRWPGRNGRVRYAHTLFNLYVVRCLELLTMRLWDAGSSGASERLDEVQAVLDRLWKSDAGDQPVLVRDARWLVQTAQSLATDDLGAYFHVAERIAESFRDDDCLEIHNAGVRMTGGHLRSQIRYHAVNKGVPIDDAGLVLITRTSNALDFALLVQELVPLLTAYEEAVDRDDRPKRLALADAICQGISPDPELFLNRIDLLGAYTMIEHLFVTTEPDGRAAYTTMGRRHVQLVNEYGERIRRVAKPLLDECPRFRPVPGAYSPYGVLYGFSADVMKHMALKVGQPDAASHFALEDAFVAGGADKLAWVTGWRKLPHIARNVEAQFEYPQQFADQMYGRIEDALRRRVADDVADARVQTGRLFVEPADAAEGLPIRYVVSSDAQIIAARHAEPCDEAQLLTDRREGKFVVSYQTPGGWVGIAKSLLTDVLGVGRDVTIAGLPRAAVGVLTLTCPTLVVTA